MLKDLSELISANVISQETADKISAYYNSKKNQSENKLFIVFGILGAILVGLGIILILAHNWDEFPRLAKTTFAFLPLLSGQMVCLYALLKKNESSAWRESGATFLFFAVGASISLVSQIYNISGDLKGFLLTWMLLCLPVIYLMRSSVVSLLYIIGITYYVWAAGNSLRLFWRGNNSGYLLYWTLLPLGLYHYYQLYIKKPSSNFTIFHHWFVPISLVIALSTVSSSNDEVLNIAYMSLFGLFYLIGSSDFFNNQKLRINGYLIIGSLGTIIQLLLLSFNYSWNRISEGNFSLFSEEAIASVILTILSLAVLLKSKRAYLEKPLSIVFALFVPIFLIGLTSSISWAMINVLIFIIGILTIRDGAKRDHLGVLNYGLIIITVLVTCRFFDTDLSFALRGILFLSVGVGFFVANYQTLKKRKADGN